MDYQKFVDQLPNLYENWGQESIHPKSNKFHKVLEQVTGMTTANVMQLLNFAVGCMEANEVYCEIGCFHGSTLIGALLDQPERIAYAVDNFSEFDDFDKNFDRLAYNLSLFNLDEQVTFCNQDFEEFFFELREIEPITKIGVYFYDGAHDYRSQLLGLLLSIPFLADKALIIVDDSNYDTAQQANWDFMAAYPQCKLLLNLPTPKNFDPTFWNGIQIFSWDINQRNNYDYAVFNQQFRNQPLIDAIYNLQFAFFNHKKEILKSLHKEATAFELSGNLIAAEKKYQEALNWNINDDLTWHNLGILYYRMEKYRDALKMLLKSVEINPSVGLYHYSLGLVLEKLGNTSQAIKAYQNAISCNSQLIDSYNNLANILFNAGEIEQAESIYRQGIAANPEHFGSYLNLGNLLIIKGEIDRAIAVYKLAQNLHQNDSDIVENLEIALKLQDDPMQVLANSGNYFYNSGKYQAAIDQYRKILGTQTAEASLYITLGECYEHLRQDKMAIEVYQKGIKTHPNTPKLYWQLARSLSSAGNIENALQVTREAARLFPEQLLFHLKQHLTLPVIYQNQAEIAFYRQKFTEGLEKIISQINLATAEAKQNALSALGGPINFLISYQGFNNLQLQKQYGQIVRQIMAANYPQWTQNVHIPPIAEDRKIRIGYISGCIWNHTVGKLSLGWLRHHDQSKFEIHCYHINRFQDGVTELFRAYSDVFHHIPGDLEAVAKEIVSNSLHILVFIDIGMQPEMTQLASLRLAPIQCTTWCHPETSGLPTIDYFLSSDLMEPENAQSHYSEQLVRLPNIGVSYSYPSIPEIKKNRADFGVVDDSVVYLCCQTLIKYLPQHDYILAAIAQRVPKAKFIFISRPNPEIAEQFRQRLQLAFAEFNLDSAEYCLILPVQNQLAYWHLNLISDIFLDTFSWSGGNTTLEAIACNLPIVTCPGELMRGRHSYAILKMMGITETIAKDEAEYIEIAVRLGLDRDWRAQIVQQIINNRDRLYDDKECVIALEAFYQRVVQERLQR